MIPWTLEDSALLFVDCYTHGVDVSSQKCEGILIKWMGTYLSLLDPVARERYTKRLDIVGLKEEDDPYAEHNSHKFKDDLASWSPIEYGHILCYKSMQWKSLEAYNYFQSGFVRDVNLWAINPDQCILHVT